MAEQGQVILDWNADKVTIRLSGRWRLGSDLPSASIVSRELEKHPSARYLSFDASNLAQWGSGLVSFLAETSELCRHHGVSADRSSLPHGLARLLELAESVPEKKGARKEEAGGSFFERVGNLTIGYGLSVYEFLEFLGSLMAALSKFARGKARYRRNDLYEIVQGCGANAVSIVVLIAFLVGVILAFMGAVQLQRLGASIYVADLVGIGMVREMGAMMTAIIMSGRTGAAFAAKLGTMKVTQEIDSLTTMGISPMEFLVLPRVLALVLMMPMLCLFADLVGILGGLMVGVAMLDLSPGAYLRETIETLTMANFLGGLFTATFYGGLIGISGCVRGFQCGNSSSAVGDAATEAVVMSIVMVVAACGIFAVVFDVLGI